jgi:hypothetical protein
MYILIRHNLLSRHQQPIAGSESVEKLQEYSRLDGWYKSGDRYVTVKDGSPWYKIEYSIESFPEVT